MSNAARVEALFFAALEKGTVEERATYLDTECGRDTELRRQVEKMLNAHLRVGDFLKSPVVEQLKENVELINTTNSLPGSIKGEEEKPGSCHDSTLARTAGEESDHNEQIPLEFLQAATRSDSLGRIGHYDVLEVLGKGGFGIVFRAFDEMLQRVVAVKVLAPELAVTSPARKRFVREAQSSARVRHENIVQIHAVEVQPLPYLVMEYIPGETLQQRLDRTGPLETMQVATLGRQIAEGLAAAHAAGLIHRDIKPGNILIESGPQERVKITDFGLARTADDASVSQSGIVVGTPLYMAPEQAQGEPLDHRADLFSLGSVLYTMCAGRPPFRARTTLAVLRRVAEDTPRPIQEIIPEVPRWLCDLIAQLHAKRPEDRIPSARAVADLLGHYLAHKSPMAPQVPHAPEELPAPRIVLGPAVGNKKLWRKRPGPGWHSALLAFVLLMLLAGLGYTETAGITNVSSTVIRFFSREGTLIVEVDDPGVSITIDGSDLVISGAGAKEIRLKPGQYNVQASKDGKLVQQELVMVAQNGRRVVRVSHEALSPEAKASTAVADAVAWERSVASMPPEEQVKAVIARLKEMNPRFDGQVKTTTHDGQVTSWEFISHDVDNLAPLHALKGLTTIECAYTRVSDLSPLTGLKLQRLGAMGIPASDLTPLQGMPLTSLDLYHARKVTDIRPLQGMPLEYLNLTALPVSDLSALKGMKTLKFLVLEQMPFTDLRPLRGLELSSLKIKGTSVANLAVIRDLPLKHLALDYRAEREEFLRSLKGLQRINDKPVDAFWKEVEPARKGRDEEVTRASGQPESREPFMSVPTPTGLVYQLRSID